MDNGIHLTDIGEELIAEALAFGSSLHESGNINKFNYGRGNLFGIIESGELSETVIGYRNNTYIGIDSTERVIGRFRTGFCQGIEESTFTHVGQAYNT